MSARCHLPRTLAGALTGALAAAAGAPAVAGGIEASYSADMWMPDRSDFDDGAATGFLLPRDRPGQKLSDMCVCLLSGGWSVACFRAGGVVKHLAQPGSNTKPLKTPCLILFHRGAMGYRCVTVRGLGRARG